MLGLLAVEGSSKGLTYVGEEHTTQCSKMHHQRKTTLVPFLHL